MPACSVLKFLDPMFSGPEPHGTLVPPNPTPFLSPYWHVSTLGHGVPFGKAKYSGDAETITKGQGQVLTYYFPPMLQQTDCGYFSPHFGMMANVLYPMIILFSSSKSLFTASTVLINGRPTATACLGIVNINLNCASPFSRPYGVVIALTTVKAGMRLADYLAGALAGLLQMALEYVVGKMLDKIVKVATDSLASRLFINSVTSSFHRPTQLASALGKYFGTANSILTTIEITQEYVKEGLDKATGVLIDNVENGDGKSIEDFVYEISDGFGRKIDPIVNTGPSNSF